jgi:signal transduction histidine kinase
VSFRQPERVETASPDLLSLLKTCQALSSETVAARVIDRFLRAAVECSGAWRAVLVVARGQAQFVAGRGERTRNGVQVLLGPGRQSPPDLPWPLFDSVRRSRQSVVQADDVGRHAPWKRGHLPPGANAAACIPLVDQGHASGVLWLESELGSKGFTPERIDALELLSIQAAICLRNARGRELQAGGGDPLEAPEADQIRFFEEMVRGAPLDQVLEGLVAFLESQSEGGVASILLLSENGERVRAAVAPRLPRDYVESLVVKVLSEHMPAEGHGLGAPHGFRLCWSTPISSRAGAVLGSITMYARGPGRYRGNEARLMSIAATIAAVALERAHDEEAIRAAAARARGLEEQLHRSQKMEAVGRLAGGIAHDFNNLLNVIVGYGEMVAREMPPDDPRRGRVEEILRAGERAGWLTRQLLAFGRKQALEPKLLDLNAVVTTTAEMLGRLIGEHVALVTRLQENLGLVRADPGQIEQVLMNLVLNARDALPGGGRVTIETTEVAFENQPEAEPGPRSGRYVALVVSDTGVGISPDVRARLFEPFFTTKEPGKGTGLGLATVQEIVERCDGAVAVQSAPGCGSTFTVYLPRVDGPAASLPRASSADPMPCGCETILIVEDDDAVRHLACEVLSKQGYRVLETGSGSVAIELAVRHGGPLHLVISDLVMPGMSGRELWSRLGALRPEARVLFISGYVADATATLLEAGAALLRKPFSASALARRVRELLDDSRG